MEQNLAANWTVRQALKTNPDAITVFFAFKTDCVGCPLDRFCTLADVAAEYWLPLEDFLHKLRESKNQQGESNESQ